MAEVDEDRTGHGDDACAFREGGEGRGWTAIDNVEYRPAELPMMRVEICAMRWMLSFACTGLTRCVGQGRQSHEEGKEDAHRLEDRFTFIPISKWLLQREHILHHEPK